MANLAPTISGPSSISRSTNQTISFTSLIRASDPDGSLAQYKFSDTIPGTDNGYLKINGSYISGTSVTGTVTGSNPITINAIDNLGSASPNYLTTINVTAPANSTEESVVSRFPWHCNPT